MSGRFSVVSGDLERVAGRLTGSVAELADARVPAWVSGQARVDGAVALFADAWSSGLAALVAEVQWCARQVRACSVSYDEADADAAAALRLAAQ